jgi:hypothetical protein
VRGDNENQHDPFLTDQDRIEHQCRALTSLVTGEPDVREAEAMRRGTYTGQVCGITGDLFVAREVP